MGSKMLSSHMMQLFQNQNYDYFNCEVWDNMVIKDESYLRNSDLSGRHPSLQERMRSILLDWLSEVSEVYKLQRESYYLAMDFVDRFLSKLENVPKQDLQLLGISCLFIASKIEEIYPPKLHDFAYVTDGACSEEDILEKELVVLKSLNWDLCPMTANAWLQVFLQLYSTLVQKENAAKLQNTRSPPQRNKRKRVQLKIDPCGDQDSINSGFPVKFHGNIAHLLDLAMLDCGCLQFSYSAIAAAALFHFTNEDILFQCTGLQVAEIQDAIIWMTPFALVVRDEGFEPKPISKAATDDNEPIHNIQSHTADLSLLDKAQERIGEMSEDSGVCMTDSSLDDANRDLSTPLRSSSVPFGDILTPPKSGRKRNRK